MLKYRASRAQLLEIPCKKCKSVVRVEGYRVWLQEREMEPLSQPGVDKGAAARQ